MNGRDHSERRVESPPRPSELAQLVERLWLELRLEPAEWLDEEAPSPKPPRAHAVAADFLEYVALAEEHGTRAQIAAMIQAKTREHWCVSAVRDPSSLWFVHAPSEVIAFLMGSSVIAVEPDSGARLVASWNGPAAAAEVASFLFNDVAPADPLPRDFVLEGASIRGWLEALGPLSPKQVHDAREEAVLAPRYRRGIWLAQLVQEDDLEALADIERAARDAAPPSVYASERDALAQQPELAAHWLLSHAWFGRGELLADAIARTQGASHPVVRELRTVLAPVAAAPDALEPLVRPHRPGWGRDVFERIRSWGRGA